MSSTNAIPVELGTKKVSSLLKDYAVPAIIAMTASSLYNMVDSVFIGNGIGPLALSSMGVCFPLINLSTAFGTLVGVGGSTLLSVLLGQKNYEGANKVLGNVMTLNLVVGLLLMTVCLIWMDPILRFFGATDNTIVYARDYMKIILYGNTITHLYFGLNSQMRSCGNPRFAMGLTIFTVLFNTVLDPIFIFTFGMGVKGAAIATVIAQAVALVIIMTAFNNRTRAVHFEKGIFRFNWRIAKDSLSIGLGPFLMNSAACLVNLFINQQMLKYSGDLGIGAYGILHRISFLFLMIVMGFNQGMQPIAGYNYGARKYSRVRKVYYLTVAWAVGVTTVGFLCSELLPGLMCRIFSSDPDLLDLASRGLRLTNMVFPLIGFQMVSTNFFQSLGMVNKSIFLSLSRQLLFLIPLLYILPLFMGGDGIWLSFPASDTISTIATFIMIRQTLKKFNMLEDGDDPAILGSTI